MARSLPGTRTAACFVPERKTLTTLREAAAGCRGCDLYKRGTQTVFGEGRPKAKVMMVGEQPGHEEDLAGHPFVGPAGKLLDRALAAVAIPREDVYVTNVVKHFKWEPRGKRRIHAKPNQMEIGACLPWLQAELDVVKPDAALPRDQGARPVGALGAGGPPGAGHGPSLGDPARARRRGPAPRVRRVRRGPASRACAAEGRVRPAAAGIATGVYSGHPW